jgi:hypothetical protein
MTARLIRVGIGCGSGRIIRRRVKRSGSPARTRRPAGYREAELIRVRDARRVRWPAGAEIACKCVSYSELVRDLGDLGDRRSIAPRPATKGSDFQGVFYGSDGTRTRDLRRDRAVMVPPGCPGITGDYRHEQVFSRVGLRGLAGMRGSPRRPPAGCVRDATVVSTATSVGVQELVVAQPCNHSSDAGRGRQARGRSPTSMTSRRDQS